MLGDSKSADRQARFERFVGFLDTDPRNPHLLADAAEAALAAGRFAECDALLERLSGLVEPTPSLRNLAGLSALSQRRYEDAEQRFAALLAEQDDASVRFNLAYALAMQARYTDALEQLNDQVLDSGAQAVRLKMQCLHHLGDLDAVIALGERFAEDPVIGTQICGQLATALFDADEFDRANLYAERASDSAGGLTVRGLLALHGDDQSQAMVLFTQALEVDPASGRAQLGEGLAYLSAHDYANAAPRLDRAATLLDRHAGSWLSAGWAHLMAGRIDEARTRFERSQQTDRGFAEASGALAVADLYQGRIDEARHHADVALRLDPACLSATYARSMLMAKAGQTEQGAELYRQMLQRPLGEDGPSIAQLIARRASHGLRG